MQHLTSHISFQSVSLKASQTRTRNNLCLPGERADASCGSGYTWYWPVCLLLFFGAQWTALLTHSATSNPVSGPLVILWMDTDFNAEFNNIDKKKFNYKRASTKTGRQKEVCRSQSLERFWRFSSLRLPLQAVRTADFAPEWGEERGAVLYQDVALLQGEGFYWSLDHPPACE